jgi:hypothetical protein
MRIILTLAVAGAALAACQSEDQLKQRFKSETVASCTSGMNQRGTVPGLDVSRFCNCLADRTMAGRSVQDLQNLNSSAGAAAGQEAAAQCLTEQGVGGAPAGNQAQAAGNVAEQAQNTGAEAAQEATENAE